MGLCAACTACTASFQARPHARAWSEAACGTWGQVGSPNLPAFLRQHRRLLEADYALSADGSQLSETEPSIVIGLRGALGLQVTHQTLSQDVHSG